MSAKIATKRGDWCSLDRKLEKRASGPINTALVLFCPTLDLVTLPSDDGAQLDVIRLDGETAFTIRQQGFSSAHLSAVKWHPQGHSLYVKWDDGEAETISTTTGASVEKTSGSQKATLCIDWSVHRPRRHEAAARFNTLQESYSETCIEFDPPKLDADLPVLLALIDIEDELPRLSTLPYTTEVDGPSNRIFTQQSELDRIFVHSRSRDWEQSETKFEVQSTGEIEIELSSCPGRVRCNLPPGIEQIKCSSHIFSTKHYLLCRSPLQTPGWEISLASISFDAIEGSGPFFEFYKGLLNRLHEAGRYMRHAISAMRSTWKASQDLVSRFLSLATEGLEEHNLPDLCASLYHLASTGDCLAPLREWLTETLGERNSTRWHTSMDTTYRSLTRLLSENLLPAIERASVQACRVRSLARTPNIAIVSLSETQANLVLSELDNLRLISHHMLIHTVEEAAQYAIFREWMSLQIERLAHPRSAAGQEASEKLAGLDHGKLLQYIAGGLLESRLNIFLGRAAKDIEQAPRKNLRKMATRATISSMLKKHAENPQQPTRPAVELTNVLYQVLALQDAIEEVLVELPKAFENSTAVQRIDQQFAKPASHLMDLKMSLPDSGLLSNSMPQDDLVTVLSVPLQHPQAVDVWTITRQGGSCTSRQIAPGDSRFKIADISIIDDDLFVFLIRDESNGCARLVLSNYRGDADLHILEDFIAGPGLWVPETIVDTSSNRHRKLICLADGEALTLGFYILTK